jgi:hypothetical protein
MTLHCNYQAKRWKDYLEKSGLNFMYLNFLAVAIGLYCFLESISAAGDMHGGDRLCRVGKYLLSGITGLYAIYEGIHGAATWELVMLQFAVALGVWPRMVFRLFGERRSNCAEQARQQHEYGG